MFLVVVDVHSKWIEAIMMTTTRTITELYYMFAMYRLPEQVISVDGLQFYSQVYEEKCISLHHHIIRSQLLKLSRHSKIV